MKALRRSLGEWWNHPSEENIRPCAKTELNLGMHEREHANFPLDLDSNWVPRITTPIPILPSHASKWL
jgi:hypothetical protein